MAKLLIIDDDPDIRALLKEALKKSGHETKTAESGKTGLEAVDREIPDLILLDLMMPVMNGYGFLDHLGSREIKPSIPVVILTALN
jgi:CheY-like chemotaxis protein